MYVCMLAEIDRVFSANSHRKRPVGVNYSFSFVYCSTMVNWESGNRFTKESMFASIGHGPKTGPTVMLVVVLKYCTAVLS